MEQGSRPASTCDAAKMQWVLDTLPQKPPFRFLDRITELSEKHIVAERTFRADEFFYAGHFPGDPITPGVILIESMAQAGLVAMGIYLLNVERPGDTRRALFTDCAIDFLEVVRPGQLMTIYGELIYWRRGKVQSKVEMQFADGKVAAYGTVSGLGVIK